MSLGLPGVPLVEPAATPHIDSPRRWDAPKIGYLTLLYDVFNRVEMTDITDDLDDAQRAWPLKFGRNQGLIYGMCVSSHGAAQHGLTQDAVGI
ncbi:MAG: hypothetical protein OEU36_00755 [Gammaproteobacteria bacterium]|nr:hypothetical protein [Gammaproteobacteria bacterium]